MEISAGENPLPQKPPQVFSTLRSTLLLVSLPFGILNFVLPIYGRDVGASAVEIGMLFSAFSLMMVVLRPDPVSVPVASNWKSFTSPLQETEMSLLLATLHDQVHSIF